MKILSKYKIRKLIATNKQLEAFLKERKILCKFVIALSNRSNLYYYNIINGIMWNQPTVLIIPLGKKPWIDYWKEYAELCKTN